MTVLETSPVQQPAFGAVSGELYFGMLLIFLAIAGYFIIAYIMQRWFGHGMIVAKDAWQKGLSIIQHFETGKNGVLKLARVEGDAFRHQNIRDGTLAAMPKGVNLLGSKRWVNTWALFGASIPADLLAGIAALKKRGYNSVDEVNEAIKNTDAKIDLEFRQTGTIPNIEVFDGNTVILNGYDFNNFEALLDQANKKTLIPLSVEDVPKFIKKSINPHDTEYVVALEVENETSEYKDDGAKYLFLTGLAVFLVSLGFIVIWNSVAGGAK